MKYIAMMGYRGEQLWQIEYNIKQLEDIWMVKR